MNTLYLVSLALAVSAVSAQTVTKLEQLKPLYLDTPLVRDGRPAWLLVDDPQLKPAAERVQAAAKERHGIDLEIRPDITADALAERDLIAFGNANTNAVLKRLYGMRLCYLDALYPGAGQATGGFDLSADGARPDGWQFSTPTGATHSLALDTEVFRSAPQSVRIDGVEEGQGRACVLRNMPPLPTTQTYTLSAWYKAELGPGARGTLHLDAYHGTERLALESVSLPAAADWTQAEVKLTVPEGAELPRILLYLHGSGRLWYDDVTLTDEAGHDYLAGTTGSVVRTIHNPLGTGHNVIAVGGSTVEGVNTAADALANATREAVQPVLPRLMLIQPGDSAVSQGLVAAGPAEDGRQAYREAIRRRLNTNAFVPVRDTINGTLTTARAYYLTGDERHALRYLDCWREILDSKASWTHSSMEWIFRAIEGWDLIEEAPVLTDQDRLEITQRLLDIGVANERSYGPNIQRVDRIIADGHQLDQGLCVYLMGLYFDRYYHINGHWMTLAQPLIDLAEQSPRVHDAYSYGPIIGNDFMTEYALKTGHLGYYETGACRDAAGWTMLCTDNLGSGSPFGDDGAWRSGIPVALLSKAWGYYGDDRLRWFLKGLRPPLGCFATEAPPKPPNDLLGVAVHPLHERLYQASLDFTADPRVKATWSPEEVPPAKAFDKLSLRTGFDSREQYLLLDGLTAIHHGHRDGGSILRFTDNDRLFLTEGHYLEICPERHNTLVVSRDGEAYDPPPLSSLVNAANLPHAGLVRVKTAPYNGVEWERCLLWSPENFVLVIDRVTAREAADYALTLHWQTLGEAQLKAGTLTVDQLGEGFTIQNVDGAVCTLTAEQHRYSGNYYASYPYSLDGLVKHLTQTRTVKLAEGESTTFINLLSTHPAGDPMLRAVPVGPLAVRVEGGDGPWLAGLGAQSFGQAVIDADLFLAGPHQVAVAGARTIDGGIASATCRPAVDAEVDLTSGTAVIDPTEATEIDLAMPDGTQNTLPFEPGPRELPTPLVYDATEPIKAFPPVPRPLQVRPQPPEAPELPLVRSLDLPRQPRDWTTDSACRVATNLTPLPASTWVADYAIDLQDLVRKQDALVLWTAGQQPIVTIDLGAPREVRSIVLRTMWTNNSAKGLQYRFRQATVRVADPSGTPWRELGTLQETAEPELGSQPAYSLTNLDETARFVQFALQPAEDAALFLKGIDIFGPAPPDEPLPVGLVPFASSAGTVLRAADLDRDGQRELLVGTATGALLAFDAGGQELWRSELGGPASALATGDLDGDGKLEILAGTDASTLLCLNADGTERWQHGFELFWGRQGNVRNIIVADLEGGGQQNIIVGTESWHYWRLDATGKIVWQHEILHAATDASVADLDGDGIAEIIAGHEYYGSRCLSADGKQKFGVYGYGPWCTKTAVWEPALDGTRHGVWAMEDDTVHVRDGKGQPVCDVNVGGWPVDLLPCDLDGDGQQELLAAVRSPSRNLVSLAGDGSRNWELTLPGGVLCLAQLGAHAAAGCEDGTLLLVDGRGTVVAKRGFARPVTAVAAVSEKLLAVLSGGACHLVTVP